MYLPKLTLLTIFFCLFLTTITAQDDVNYMVRISGLTSLESTGPDDCFEFFTNEYRYNVWVRDDVNMVSTSQTCIECNVEEDCSINPNLTVRNESMTQANTITVRFEAWEDDIDDSCIYEEGFFDSDDCHCEPQDVGTINFRNDPELQWNAYGPFDCGSHSVTVEVFYEIIEPLPVELADFSGRAEETINRLEWTTISEYNTELFEVEFSSDGELWNTLDIIDAKGFSNQPISYVFVDRQPLDLTYYRLNIIDYDGTEEYSDVILIENKQEIESTPIRKIYPNPSPGVFTLELTMYDYLASNLDVIDVMGKVVEQIQLTDEVNAKVILDLSDKPAGLYFVRLASLDGKVYTERIQKIGDR